MLPRGTISRYRRQIGPVHVLPLRVVIRENPRMPNPSEVFLGVCRPWGVLDSMNWTERQTLVLMVYPRQNCIALEVSTRWYLLPRKQM